jgi:ABC-type branched-subunit amino acid transport system ATPase component
MSNIEVPHMNSQQPVLEIVDLKKRFKGNHVLRGVSGSIARRKATALIGSNGAGKSTLLNVVSGLLTADSGKILLNGRDITSQSGFARARAGIGRTFQHPRAFSSLTVTQAVMLARTPPKQEGVLRNLGRAVGLAYQTSAADERQVAECLEVCRLSHLSQVTADQLSYGDRKLLMLAQALAFDRDLICLDELCAGLESNVIDYLVTVFNQLIKNGKTILFVEHNLELVRAFAQDIVFLHEGTVYRSGEASKILIDPDVVSLYLGD